jgi:N-acetylglucosaminyl-diphospho-decaprenol L-rhamnosyltransferase
LLTNPDITVVIVIYNSKDNLLKILNFFQNYNLILVDNGKNEKILNQLNLSIFKRLKIISKQKNIGYGSGCNYALEFVSTRYTLLIEPDCTISQQSIQDMFKAIIKYKSAIVVPKIYKNHHYKNENVLFPETYNLKRSEIEKKAVEIIGNTIPSGDTCVFGFLGAIMLFDNLYFKNGKFFDERYFLYFEDLQLTKNIFQKKQQIIQCNLAFAQHEDHQSSKEDIFTNFILKTNYIKSKYIYFDISIYSPILIKDFFKFVYKFLINCLKFNKKNLIRNFFYLCGIFRYIVYRIFR